jgi:hypothetical protein
MRWLFGIRIFCNLISCWIRIIILLLLFIRVVLNRNVCLLYGIIGNINLMYIWVRAMELLLFGIDWSRLRGWRWRELFKYGLILRN